MTVPVRLRMKHRVGKMSKSVKNMKAGNGKRARGDKVSWRRGTGEGTKR